ncbi:transcriptional regulator [Amycolatopsis sp. NBRC 101858]|uniref:Scr1 family TA system antitoxin-like transcriptional regulator n=1 Tax=Amycolatopsis sp. NBRC 101858 TaxID=3032200 RepID=UPI0024A07C5B|nr:Scr1 family TA system antitoxin-like transcriptional regulator [Amycolatopsis sp. NBRC 101858]GLY38851.1 transcriptional regulator [Amycolatopsis sp. NBRC 101858]
MTDGPSRLPGLYVLGSALRELRDSRGISLRQLAAKLGFNPSTLSGWEKGARPIDPAQLGWYLGYLHVAPAEYQLMMRLHGQSERTSHIESLAAGEASLQDVYLRYAVHTYEWAPRVVPDLLQTSEYAHAVLGRDSQPDDVDLEILYRQVRQLGRDPQHRHTVLLGAAALNHEFVSAEIRDEQLQHITTSAKGRISTQIVPDNLSFAGTTEPFVIYETTDGIFAVVLRHEHTTAYLSDSDTVKRYLATFYALQRKVADYRVGAGSC